MYKLLTNAFKCIELKTHTEVTHYEGNDLCKVSIGDAQEILIYINSMLSASNGGPTNNCPNSFLSAKFGSCAKKLTPLPLGK